MTDELRLERVIDAPPDVVFDAFTTDGGQIAFYGTDDPGWIVESQCDLREQVAAAVLCIVGLERGSPILYQHVGARQRRERHCVMYGGTRSGYSVRNCIP